MSAKPDFITEPQHQVPVFRKVDVVVVGGGPAGFAAAVSAARNGADTLLVERNSFLGGTGPAGFVNQFRQMYHLCGIPREVVRKLGEAGCSSKDAQYGYVHSMAFDQEELKFICIDMVEAASARIILNTWAVAPIVENKKVTGVIIENKSGRQAILANVVIDASGDADIAARAGAPFSSQRNDKRLPFTMGFRLGGLDYKKISDYALKNPHEFSSAFSQGHFDGYANNAISGWMSLVKEARDGNELPGHFSRFTLEGITPFALERGTGYIYGIQSLHRDPCDAQDMSDAESETKKKARMFLKFLKKVPGFESSYLIDFAKNIGVIDSRLIIGEYVLSEDDVFQNHLHEDDIALIVLAQPKGGWEKRHPPDGSEGSEAHRLAMQKLPVFLGRFGIPYRCLLPKTIDRLLVVGRNFSSSYEAMFAGRQMFECMATGEAAGAAAAIAVKQKISPKQVNIEALRKTLAAQGVVLDPDAIDLVRVRKMYEDRGMKLS
jgi:hypothetical protein